MREQFHKHINLNIIIIFILIAMSTLLIFLFSEVQRGNQLSWLDSAMPYFFVFCFIFIFLVVGIMPFYDNMIISKNTATLARLLNTEAKRPFFGLWFSFFGLWFYKVIKGTYKGREIICSTQFIIKDAIVYICIKPNIPPERHKSGFLAKRITDKTSLSKDKIWYLPNSLDGSNLEKLRLVYKLQSEEDFIDIFEELTKAAEIVENSQEL